MRWCWDQYTTSETERNEVTASPLRASVEPLDGLPEGFSLPVHAATHDHGVGVCIWEGPSVESVRDLVEAVVGPYSENEYFEMSVDGLPEPAKT